MSQLTFEPHWSLTSWSKTQTKLSNPTGSSLHFGNGIGDKVQLQNKQARRARQQAALQKDYGEGVTGREVLSLIVELWDADAPASEKLNQRLKKDYETALQRYEQRNPLIRVLLKKPEEPNYHIQTLSTADVLKYYKGTPERIKAAEAALYDGLQASGLIAFQPYSSGASFSLLPGAKELLRNPKR